MMDANCSDQTMLLEPLPRLWQGLCPSGPHIDRSDGANLVKVDEVHSSFR